MALKATEGGFGVPSRRTGCDLDFARRGRPFRRVRHHTRHGAWGTSVPGRGGTS